MATAATFSERTRLDAEDHQRELVLRAARDLLIRDGATAVTMRRVANEIGASTTVLYKLFGGKDGLAEALYLDGFARLADRLAAIDAGTEMDPWVRFSEMARQYRLFGLDDPASYHVMFHRSLAAYEPSPAAVAFARRSLDLARDAAAACVKAGILAGDPEVINDVLWATCHGCVSLELTGHFSAEEATHRFLSATGALALAFAPPRPT